MKEETEDNNKERDAKYILKQQSVLEKAATNLVKASTANEKLQQYTISKDFLNLF